MSPLGCLLEAGEGGWLAAVLLAVNRLEGRGWGFMPKRGLRDTGIPSLSRGHCFGRNQTKKSSQTLLGIGLKK